MWRTSHGQGQSIRIDYQNRGAADSRHRSALLSPTSPAACSCVWPYATLPPAAGHVNV